MQNPVMSSRRAESGVCIVRVEVQSEHLLITVTTKQDIGRNLYPASSASDRHFADPDAALQAVADFLASFAPPIRDSGGDSA